MPTKFPNKVKHDGDFYFLRDTIEVGSTTKGVYKTSNGKKEKHFTRNQAQRKASS